MTLQIEQQTDPRTGRQTEPPAAADWRALGCSVRLVVADPAQLDLCRSRLAAWLDAVDGACSRFLRDSEISEVCRAAGPAEISPLLADALDAAIRAARLTDGLVDPTVGAAMAAVGYDRDFELIEPQGAPIRVTLRPVPGWHLIDLERPADGVPGPCVLRLRDGITLDLGATAKAWAADSAAAELAKIAGCGVLVALGGDIAVAGRPPLRSDGERSWRITVRDRTDARAAVGARDEVPESPAGLGPEAEIGIVDGGVATSGTSSRRWLRGGDLLHHILDPRTGLPAATPWRTVSVAAGNCLDANTASTAAVLLGAKAPAWLTMHGLPARLVPEDGGPIVYTPGWPADAEVRTLPDAPERGR
ncbi:MAG TPA: FAD:protein FMN transferase [Actinospica sp.]|nr:FAD:protein FMN transferase [Actinospica sp.]